MTDRCSWEEENGGGKCSELGAVRVESYMGGGLLCTLHLEKWNHQLRHRKTAPPNAQGGSETHCAHQGGAVRP